MPLPVAHSIVGLSLVLAFDSRSHPINRAKALFLGASLANLPDLDFIPVLLSGIPEYHRGFTHSLFLGGALLVFLVIFKKRVRFPTWPAYAAAFTSHCLLDFLLTKGGGGLELWWPFSAKRVELGLVSISEFHWQSESLTELTRSMLLNSLKELLIFAPLLLGAIIFHRSRVRRERVN